MALHVIRFPAVAVIGDVVRLQQLQAVQCIAEFLVQLFLNLADAFVVEFLFSF